jgi:hypothetical protein
MSVQPPPYSPRGTQQTSAAATIAIVAAIIGWIVLFAAYPGWSFLLNIIAVVAGIFGLVLAASPRVSGGIASIIGIVLGAVGIILAIFGMAGSLFV